MGLKEPLGFNRLSQESCDFEQRNISFLVGIFSFSRFYFYYQLKFTKPISSRILRRFFTIENADMEKNYIGKVVVGGYL